MHWMHVHSIWIWTFTLWSALVQMYISVNMCISGDGYWCVLACMSLLHECPHDITHSQNCNVLYSAVSNQGTSRISTTTCSGLRSSCLASSSLSGQPPHGVPPLEMATVLTPLSCQIPQMSPWTSTWLASLHPMSSGSLPHWPTWPMPFWSWSSLLCPGNYQWWLWGIHACIVQCMTLYHRSFHRTTGVYARILLKIVVSDMVKFSVIFVIILYIFVGSFYLSLKAGVSAINMSTGVIISDLDVFELQTLWALDVMHTCMYIYTQYT